MDTYIYKVVGNEMQQYGYKSTPRETLKIQTQFTLNFSMWHFPISTSLICKFLMIIKKKTT